MTYSVNILLFMYVYKYTINTKTPLPKTTSNQKTAVNRITCKPISASYIMFSLNTESWVPVAHQALPYLQDATTILSFEAQQPIQFLCCQQVACPLPSQPCPIWMIFHVCDKSAFLEHVGEQEPTILACNHYLHWNYYNNTDRFQSPFSLVSMYLIALGCSKFFLWPVLIFYSAMQTSLQEENTTNNRP